MLQPPVANSNQSMGMRQRYIAQQQTLPQQVPSTPSTSLTLPGSGIPNTQTPIPVVPLAASAPSLTLRKKRNTARISAVLLVLGLATAIYFIWHTASPTTTATPSNSSDVSQQNFSAVTTSVPTTDGIRVYVVGAVKNPGIYMLASDARVYDLLQAAGGPLPNANLVTINLAAKLSDGQEVYIAKVGETPPTYSGGVSGTGGGSTGTGSATGNSSGGSTGTGSATGNSSGSSTGTGSTAGISTNGQLVNINTASVVELSQSLHVSKKTAQTIVDYRTQNGNFSSVDQLAQVVSSGIYKKIKAQCTV